MVRNQIPQGGGNDNKGYLVFGEKGNGEAEFMHDAGGNGQVNDSGEPVANGCGTGSAPTWLKVEKFGKKFSVYCSRDGRRGPRSASRPPSPRRRPQDIGLFVVSHISGTKATAKFTTGRWTPTRRPRRPGEPSTPPRAALRRAVGRVRRRAQPRPLDDRPRPAASAPATANGALNLSVINGDIDGANTAPVSHVGQKTPGRELAGLDEGDARSRQRLAVRRPRDPRRRRQLHEAHVHPAHGRARASWSSGPRPTGRTAHGGNAFVASDHPAAIHLRLTNKGGTLTGAYSTNGTDWTNMGGTGR